MSTEPDFAHLAAIHGQSYSPTANSHSPRSADSQLKQLIRAVKHLSADFSTEDEGFDQSDPKGIFQALKALRELSHEWPGE